MNLRLATINVRGLMNDSKRSKFFRYLKSLCISTHYIFFVQETHCPGVQEASRWTTQWGGKALFTTFSSSSCGVAILFSPRLIISLSSPVLDSNGRYIAVNCVISLNIELNLHLLCIYAPNTPSDRVPFFDSLSSLAPPNSSSSTIIAGDFNCILDPKLDKVGGNHDSGSEGSLELSFFTDSLMTRDSFRILHPDLVSTTYRSNSVGTRIDRIYICDSLLPYCSTVSHDPFTISDHDLVTSTLTFSKVKRGKGYWKFNCALLSDTLFASDIIQQIEVWQCTTLIRCNGSVFEAWDSLKSAFRAISIKHSLRRKSRLILSTEQAKKDTDAATRAWHLHNSPSNWSVLAEASNNLKSLENTYLEGAAIRSRAMWFEKGEKPTSYFCKLESTRYADNTIHSLTSSNGVISFLPKEMCKIASEYYSSLYSDDSLTDANATDSLLRNIPTLDSQSVDFLESPLTLEELSTAVKSSPPNKAPGLDGLPTDFLKFFWRHLGPILLELFNECFILGCLPSSSRKSVLSLLFKKGDRSLLSNWRPLSLICSDAKLLCKVLALRLKRVIPTLVHTNQAGFIRGRLIHDHILSAQLAITFAKANGISGALLLLDQEKAFDRVNWRYRDAVLQRFGFGPNFLRWISVIHTNISSSVQINGFLSPSFIIHRGTRQGDPLSPSLFALLEEPFACALRSSETFSGLVLGSCTLKLLQYADDKLFGLSCPNDYLQLKSLLNLYSAASGAKINDNKSELIALNFGITKFDWSSVPAKIVYENETTRYLGIQIGVNPSNDNLWNVAVSKFNSTIASWSSRNLSLRGKITVIRTLALSQLWFILYINLLPSDLLKSLQITCFKFLWSNANKGLLSRDKTFLPILQGGLAFPNIDIISDSLHVQWLKRILDPSFSQPWKVLLLDIFSSTRFSRTWGLSLSDLVTCDVNFTHKKNFLPSALSFLENALATSRLLNLTKLHPATIQDILSEHIFYNPLILGSDGQSLGAASLLLVARSRITHIKHIWDSNTASWFHSSNTKIQHSIDYIIQCIPSHWKTILARDSPNDTLINNPLDRIFVRQHSSSSSIRNISVRGSTLALSSSLLKPPSPSHFWTTLCHPLLPPSQRIVWNWVWSPLRERKINDFIWKLLHNSLPLGSIIGKWSNHSLCPCSLSVENTSHLFFDCSISQICWSTFIKYWADLTQKIVTLSPLLIFLSKPSINSSFLSKLWVMLHGCMLYSIWTSRCYHLFNDAPYNPLVITKNFAYKSISFLKVQKYLKKSHPLFKKSINLLKNILDSY